MSDNSECGSTYSAPAVTHRWSQDCGEIFGALAKAQAEIKNAIKDSDNSHFRSKFADLASVKEACWEALTKHDIAVVQMPINGDASNIGVVTVFGHKSGGWIESTIYVAPMKFDAQGAGSVITYLRRYALAAMAGVAPEDDDDGQAAVARPQASAAHQSETRTVPAPRPAPQRHIAQVPPPSPEEPPMIAEARSASRFWERPSYAIDPDKLEGGLSTWGERYLRTADNAPNLAALDKLRDDNVPYYERWYKAAAKPVSLAFLAKMGEIHNRIADAEADPFSEAAE